jgi:lipopolysaccharide/colanic/teichoic acid biosynthesis glycosyltransferase
MSIIPPIVARSRSRLDALAPRGDVADFEILPQKAFLKTLHWEQKRTERSHSRFVLMLLEAEGLLEANATGEAFEQILSALVHSTRETDCTGWYKAGSTIGTIFTEIGDADGKAVAKALLMRVSNALACTLSIERINQLRLSFHVFPEDWADDDEHPSDGVLHANPDQNGFPRRASLLAKRGLDVFGSLFALVVFSPLFLVIGIAIKLTSKGPVLFRQQRVGQHGHKFTFLKFRSMFCGNNDAIHREYVKRLISGVATTGEATVPSEKVYKLTNDPRVTRVGRFLRKTSLDELPQFLNVLKGEMSLVGPRPPVPYEVKNYSIWHRRRLLTVKPGITGLWQVTSRSKVGFDDMVRLDLTYARSWSLWLDVKILLQTPRAVLGGDGAY